MQSRVPHRAPLKSLVSWTPPRTGEPHPAWEVIDPTDGPEGRNTPAGTRPETALPRGQLAGWQSCPGRAGAGDALAER